MLAQVITPMLAQVITLILAQVITLILAQVLPTHFLTWILIQTLPQFLSLLPDR